MLAGERQSRQQKTVSLVLLLFEIVNASAGGGYAIVTCQSGQRPMLTGVIVITSGTSMNYTISESSWLARSVNLSNSSVVEPSRSRDPFIGCAHQASSQRPRQ